MPMKQVHAEKIIELLSRILEKQELCTHLADAYLYRSRTRCGRDGCKCMNSEYRHESDCLSFVEDGVSRTRTVRKPALAEVRKLTGDYRQLRELRKELVKQHKEFLTEFDRQISRKLRLGRKHLKTVLAKEGRNND